jgi:hypothetical protein
LDPKFTTLMNKEVRQVMKLDKALTGFVKHTEAGGDPRGVSTFTPHGHSWALTRGEGWNGSVRGGIAGDNGGGGEEDDEARQDSEGGAPVMASMTRRLEALGRRSPSPEDDEGAADPEVERRMMRAKQRAIKVGWSRVNR